MVFVETTAFGRRRDEYLDDGQYQQFQRWLALHPESGDVIPGTGGARKVRWAVRGHGKRGGLRVVYVYFSRAQRIYLLTAYAKSEATDLTQDQRKAIQKIIQAIRHELKAEHRPGNP